MGHGVGEDSSRFCWAMAALQAETQIVRLHLAQKRAKLRSG